MLSIFYQLTGPQIGQQENIKILNNVYLTIFKPTFSSKKKLEKASNIKKIEERQEKRGEQTQMVLIKSKLGQFKAIWSCKIDSKNKKIKNNQKIKKIKEINSQEKILKELGRKENMRTIILHDDKHFWISKKEKKHFIFYLKSKKIEDRCFLSAKEQKNTYREWPLFQSCIHVGGKNKENQIYEVDYVKKKQEMPLKVYSWANRIIICECINWEKIKEKDQKKKKKEEISIQSTQLTKQLKNIMTGVTQGYTKNLESKGIGYQGKIIEQKVKNHKVKREQENKNGITTKLIKKKTTKSMKSTQSKKQKNPQSHKIHKIKKKKKQKKTKKKITAAELQKKWGQLEKKIEETKFTKLTTLRKKTTKKVNTIKKNEEIKKYLVLNLGWSHQIKYLIPEQQISASILQTGTISISGISSFQVNQTAAKIYKFKKPEPYKGKGIRYDGEKYFEKTRKG